MKTHPPSTTRRALLLIFVLLVPPGTVAVVSGLTRYPRRFAALESGRLCRGSYPSGEQIRHLVDDYHIAKIVNLTSKSDDLREREEMAVAEELGLGYVQIEMPGNGCADFEKLDQAADAIAVEADWPVFFHCAAGKQRSNAALAAYRARHCGWSLEQILKELDHHGLDRDEERILCDHLAAYMEHVHRVPE